CGRNRSCAWPGYHPTPHPRPTNVRDRSRCRSARFRPPLPPPCYNPRRSPAVRIVVRHVDAALIQVRDAVPEREHAVLHAAPFHLILDHGVPLIRDEPPRTARHAPTPSGADDAAYVDAHVRARPEDERAVAAEVRVPVVGIAATAPGTEAPVRLPVRQLLPAQVSEPLLHQRRVRALLHPAGHPGLPAPTLRRTTHVPGLRAHRPLRHAARRREVQVPRTAQVRLPVLVQLGQDHLELIPHEPGREPPRPVPDHDRPGRPAPLDRAPQREIQAGAGHGAREDRALLLERERDGPVRPIEHVRAREGLGADRAGEEEEHDEDNATEQGNLRVGDTCDADHDRSAHVRPYAQPGDRGSSRVHRRAARRPGQQRPASPATITSRPRRTRPARLPPLTARTPPHPALPRAIHGTPHTLDVNDRSPEAAGEHRRSPLVPPGSSLTADRSIRSTAGANRSPASATASMSSRRSARAYRSSPANRHPARPSRRSIASRRSASARDLLLSSRNRSTSASGLPSGAPPRPSGAPPPSTTLPSTCPASLRTGLMPPSGPGLTTISRPPPQNVRASPGTGP